MRGRRVMTLMILPVLILTPATALAESSIDVVASQLDEAQSEAEDVSEQISELESGIDDTNRQIEEAQANIDTSRSALSSSISSDYKDGSSFNVIAGILSQNADLSSIVSHLAYASDTRSSMSDDISSVNNEVSSLTSMREAQEQQMTELSSRQDELNEKVRSLQEKKEALGEQYAKAITSRGMKTTSTNDTDTIKQMALSEVEGDAIRTRAIEAAFTQLGVPYGFGSYSPGRALDCSGFVKYAYSQAGVSLPHSSVSQSRTVNRKSSLDELKPGDLIFWVGTSASSGSGSHVAMWLGNGVIIHESWGGCCVQALYDGYNAFGSVE